MEGGGGLKNRPHAAGLDSIIPLVTDLVRDNS